MKQQKTKAELEEELYRLCCKGKAEEIWDWVLENCTLKTIPLDAEVKPAACDRCKELEELLSKYKYDMDAYFNPHYCFGYLYSEYKQQKPRFEKLLGIGTHSYIIEQQVNTLLTILEGKLPSKLSV